MNYSKEVTDYIVAEYTAEPCRATVDRLAEELGKSAKSVIGKLSREGVYRREVYKTKAGATPVTKAELVSQIAECVDLETEQLEGLEKTPKLVLQKLLAVLEEE